MLRHGRLSAGRRWLARGCIGIVTGHAAVVLAAYAVACARFGAWLDPTELASLCGAGGSAAGLHAASTVAMTLVCAGRDAMRDRAAGLRGAAPRAA